MSATKCFKRFLNLLIWIFTLIFFLTGFIFGQSQKGEIKFLENYTADFAPDRLLVKFRDGITQSSADNIAHGLGAISAKRIHQQGLFLIKLVKGKEIGDVKKLFEKESAVEFVEPDYRVYADNRTPNDPQFSQQWGLHNTGQMVNNVSGTPDADIDAPEAWDKTTGNSQVIIAIVDAGVAWDHPDLQANIWQNPGETLDGIDNDNNGYIDDIRGWDFVNDDNDPYDFNGHGSHVAGIAAAVGNNSIGVTGVSWTAKIMPLRFLGVTGSGYISDAIEAINYAVQNGAKIINASYGSSQYTSSERLAIESAKTAGVLFIAAAGSKGTNNESSHHYPSDYDLDNIISVAATDQNDALASFSNYGTISVDVGAPGANIYSTLNIAPLQLFFDDMESGEGNWEKQTPWALTTSKYYSSSHSWTDSPSGNYGNNVNTSLTLKNPISLVGFQGAKLSFKLNMITESRYDFLWIEASSNKVNWKTLSQLSGSTGGAWFNWENDLTDFDGESSVYIRFRLTSDGSYTYDGAYIDDVMITAFLTPPYTYTGSEYGFFNGTSMSTAYVTGLASLILANAPSFSYDQIRNRILTTVDPLASLSGKIATGGRINAKNAVADPPDITVSPDSFEVTLSPDDSTVKTMTIGNVGQGDLTYMISMAAPPVNWLSFSPIAGTVAPGVSQGISVKFRSAGLTPGSTYHTKLIISSNDPDEPSLNIPVHLTVHSGELVPTHFVFRDSTGESYSIVIDKATIDNNLLQVKDEIGVFTPAGLCVGASVWTGTMPLALTAWKDDSQTPAVDGYKDGEKMFFRIWDESDSKECPATPTYSVGNGNFGDGAYARISNLVAQSTVQIIPLSSGWSWISLHVKPDTLDVAVVMRGLKHLAIVINGAGQFYIPGVVNSIGNMNVLEGYKVYVNANDTLVVQGQEVPVSTPIYLNVGWNFVSYLPKVPMSPEHALASIITNLAIAQNDVGGFFIPGVVNSMGNMMPGEGYKLYMNAVDTLIYPAGPNLTKPITTLVVTAITSPTHFKFAATTGESHCLLITELKINGQNPSPGSEVGIFTESGVCVGGGVWKCGAPLAISAWEDDQQTAAIDGYQPGERMIFKFWQPDQQAEIELVASFQSGDGMFKNESYTRVQLQSIPLPDNYELNQNYPNPFNAETIIKYQLPQAGKISLVVYNLIGQEIKRLVDDYQSAGYHTFHWDGKDSLGRPVTSGIYVYRLEAGTFINSKKLIIIK